MRDWRVTRRKYHVVFTIITLVLALGTVVALNLVFIRYNQTYDATANRNYSLSPETVRVVHQLQEDVTLTYFDRGSRLAQARELLGEYAALSRRIHVRYVDAEKHAHSAPAGVTRYGVTAVQVGSNKEQATRLSEAAITGAIYRGIKNLTRTACFLSGNGEHSLDDTASLGYSRFKDLLADDDYRAVPISLLSAPTVPGDCTALVISGPTRDYSQPDVEAIGDYVLQGGNALFLLDPPLKTRKAQIAENRALTQLLAHWGVNLGRDLILDLSPMGQMAGLGPQIALVTSYGSQPIVSDMTGTATGFPLSRSMVGQNTSSTRVENLLVTSATSVATQNLSSEQVDAADSSNQKGPMTIGLAGIHTGISKGRFVVVGTSLWLANAFIEFNGNGDLALNVMNWLAPDAISIPPKPPDQQRITMTRAQFAWVRIIAQFLLPLAAVLGAVAVWRRE
jgi:ABC-type uncharacterized transport system involved in gliding motility auxiliary subunit